MADVTLTTDDRQFAAGDPVGFGRAVASIFGARLDRVGDTVRLSRPARRG